MAYYRLPSFPTAYDYEKAADYYERHGDNERYYEMRVKQLEREIHDKDEAQLREKWNKEMSFWD